MNLAFRTELARMRGEQGVAFPVVVMVLAVVMLLILVAGASVISAQSQSRRDISVKQALAAADAGVQLATQHLSQLDPYAGECVEKQSGSYQLQSRSTPWCPTQSEPLDDGNSVSFRVTSQVGGDPLQRRIVAVGMDNCTSITDTGPLCVKRRVVTAAKSDQTQFGLDTAVYALNDLELRDDKGIVEINPSTGVRCDPPYGGDPSTASFCGATVYAGGNVTFGRRDALCGRLFMKTAKTYWNKDAGPSAGCLGAPVDAANQPLAGTSTGPTSTPLKDPPVNGTATNFSGSALLRLAPTAFPIPDPVKIPSDIETTSANCRITAALGSGGCPPVAGSGVQPDVVVNPVGISWNATTKVLRLDGTNTQLTLRGGKYNFCYLEIKGGKLNIQPVLRSPGVYEPTEIYIEPPGSPNCPNGPSNSPAPTSVVQSGMGWGSLWFWGGSNVINTSGDPSKVQFLVAGSNSRSDDSVILNHDGRQKLIIYAPNSHVELTNQPGGVTKVVSESLLISGNAGIEWDDRAAVPVQTESFAYRREHWFECRAMPTNGSFTDPSGSAQPDSGCEL